MTKPIGFRHPEIERLDRDGIIAIQRRKLGALGERLAGDPGWVRHFQLAGMSPRDLADPSALGHAPTLEKSDLRALYPYPLLTVQIDQVERFVGTSGTTGLPVLFGFTKHDVHTLTEQMARAFTIMDFRAGDRFYQAMRYGMWIGGWAIGLGLRTIGAINFPIGPGRGELVLRWMKDHGYTACAAAPLWLGSLVRMAYEQGIDPRREWSLRVALSGVEVVSRGYRDELESQMPPGFRMHNMYGSTEAGGPVVLLDCAYSHDGDELHLFNEDGVITEILDPVTLKPVAPGEVGEIVITTLDKEASPVVRWRTRDLVRMSPHPYDCPCGRKGMPLTSRIIGRSDDMLKVRGAIVFPSQVEDIVVAIPDTVKEAWQIYVDRADKTLDTFTIAVERRQDSKRAPAEIEQQIKTAFQARLGISAAVECRPEGSLPRYEGKAVRVIVRTPTN